MYHGGTIAVVTDDSMSLNWSGGHNIYRADGACGAYPNLAAFQSAASYTAIEPTYPGQNPYALAIPSVSNIKSYCYACISHYGSMRFTLEVSPAVSNVICVEDTTGVRMWNGTHIALRDIEIGDQIATPSGYTTVKGIVSQLVRDVPWVVPAGRCDATSETTLSPAHAVRCEGVWKSAQEIGNREKAKKAVRYINLLTDNYCEDMMMLDTGLVVETWDGRGRNEWRPHEYKDGLRLNCRPLNTTS